MTMILGFAIEFANINSFYDCIYNLIYSRMFIVLDEKLELYLFMRKVLAQEGNGDLRYKI